MTKNIQDLYEFIDRAEKNRKYPTATASGLKAALRLFEAELNEDEKSSVDLFKKNLEQIYHSVTVNNGKSMSSGSLVTYRSRINKIISHFEKYGVDPTKMASWNPKVITRKQQSKKASKTEENQTAEESASPTNNITSNDNFIFDFKGNIKLVIPKNAITNEAIMDGELKDVKSGLKAFAEKFGVEDVQDEEVSAD